MSQKPNTTCRVCGKQYFACMRSKEYGGYKMVACSPDCWQIYQIDVMLERNEEIPKEWENIANERKILKEKREQENKKLQSELAEKTNIELGVEVDNIEEVDLTKDEIDMKVEVEQIETIEHPKTLTEKLKGLVKSK